MAARLAGDNVRRMHQSLHHVVADAPWSDEVVLDRCLDFVIPAMLRRDPVVAWVVDDTGFPNKGRESVGVARCLARRSRAQPRTGFRSCRCFMFQVTSVIMATACQRSVAS
jgi:DDE superfamily endonuclease